MGLLGHKICLITGAGCGIGAGTVRRFAEEGAVAALTKAASKNCPPGEYV